MHAWKDYTISKCSLSSESTDTRRVFPGNSANLLHYCRPRKLPSLVLSAINLTLNVSLQHTIHSPSTCLHLVHARGPDHEGSRELVASGSERRWLVVALEDIFILTLSSHKVVVLCCTRMCLQMGTDRQTDKQNCCECYCT